MHLFRVLIVIYVNAVLTIAMNEMHMIVDVVKYFDKPTCVAAMTVWKPNQNLQLANLVMKRTGSTVIFLKNIKAMDHLTPSKDVLFLLDLSLPDVEIILNRANATDKFRSPYRWLIIGSNSYEIFPPNNNLKNLHILVDSEVIISSGNMVNDTFLLNMIYKSNAKRNWTLEYFGTWKVNEGLTIPTNISSTSIAMRRKNLQQERIKTCTVNPGGKTVPDFESPRNDLDNIPIVASYWQMKHLFEFINASHDLILYGSWGYKNNGTWTGLIGGMVYEDVELSAILMFITKQRLDTLSYLAQPVVSSVVFVFREPRLSYQNNLFLLPFRANVWYSIFGLTVLIILVLYFVSLWESKKHGRIELSACCNWLQPDFSDITIFALSAFTQQGNTSELKGGLGRIVIYLLLLICLFLYTAYSASIMALLQSSSDQIRTLTDLLNSKLELGVDDTPYNKHYFTTVTEPVRATIYNKKIAPKGSKANFMPMEEGVKKLQKEPFAFNMFTSVGYRVIESLFLEHEKCGLREIAYIDVKSPWFSCKKTSHYKEMYKVGLYRLREHGIFSRVSNLFYAKKPVCSVRGGSFVSVNIVDFYPALLVLVYGALGSLIILAVELLVFKRTRRLARTRDNTLL